VAATRRDPRRRPQVPRDRRARGRTGRIALERRWHERGGPSWRPRAAHASRTGSPKVAAFTCATWFAITQKPCAVLPNRRRARWCSRLWRFVRCRLRFSAARRIWSLVPTGSLSSGCCRFSFTGSAVAYPRAGGWRTTRTEAQTSCAGPPWEGRREVNVEADDADSP
jgi:hypothetical protein